MWLFPWQLGHERARMTKALLFFLLSFLLLTVDSDEGSGYSYYISINEMDIVGVSSSISLAEKWVKGNILDGSKEPKNIVIGGGFLCNPNYKEYWSSVLPAIENIYFSLKRLGLEKKVKVSTIIPTNFLENPHHPPSSKFAKTFANTHLKPLLNFLQNTNSNYFLHQSSHLSSSSHASALGKMGLYLNMVLVRETGTSSIRKLAVEPFKTRPTSSSPQTITASPLIPPFGFSFPPTNFPKDSLPPSASQRANPPPLSSLASSPENSDPVSSPTEPPAFSPSYYDGFGFPPCRPVYKAPKSVFAGEKKYESLWCVAKPSVPEETLQKAMEYACGEGEADCGEIMPRRSCYFPNTLISHASYAFNSYWQKAKSKGGTCDFGGTAMLINADPSFINCRYVLK